MYNSHLHPYQNKTWREVHIIHCKDLEDKLGTAGQFYYDLNCILDTHKRDFDIILQLGYTSSSVWGWLLHGRRAIITTNMDGLEWKRSKYSMWVQRFLKYAERLAVKYSDHLIADSKGIQDYLQIIYNQRPIFIPYGAEVFTKPKSDILVDYGLKPYAYNMLIARLEPENSIETILDGVVQSQNTDPFIVIGKHTTAYGDMLKTKYAAYPAIQFIGGIYDITILNNIRYYSNLYFHGHTVGGTNPSLLEAMASGSLIAAHDNIFNRSVLGSDAMYFYTSNEVANYITTINKQLEVNLQMIKRNIRKIENEYKWDLITGRYINHFQAIYQNKQQEAYVPLEMLMLDK